MDKSTSRREEFDSICRLCVKLFGSEKVSPIFNNENYNEQISLPERIWFCSSIEVYEGDGLPAQICSSCLLKLNQSFVFRNQCILADNTLKRLARDIDFSLSNLPDIINESLENKVIEQDTLDFNSEERKNNSNSSCIDEFDNSKNGRHKRNINKKDESQQKIKMCNGSGNENVVEDVEYNDLSLSESNLHNDDCVEESCELQLQKQEDSEDKGARKKKGKLKKDLVKRIQEETHSFFKNEDSIDLNLGKENRIKAKRNKKIKVKKSDNADLKDDIKVEIKEENSDNFEDFTVEVDVFSFNEGKKEFDFKEDEDDEEDIREGEKKKQSKKLSKDKSAAGRRGRPRKYPVIKEKPPYYTCEYCQKVYPSEGGWRYHIHTMHNENYQPFICDLCGKAFKVKKNLEGHKNSVHYHLKQHLCDLCGRGFASKYALKVHKIWHNDEKNFPCDICGTKFRTRGKMNTHRSIHGGPKKFMCHVCSRDFRWKKDFEIHMRTHTGEKPFKCSLCGKAFSSLTNMKKHERNHAGKFGSLNGPEIIETTTIPLIPDERLYKADLPFSFNYSVDEIRNRPVE